MDSIFQLRRPYDFLALAQQEQRAMQVESLKRELVSQKSQIDRNEDKVSYFSLIHLGFVHFHCLYLVQCGYTFYWSNMSSSISHCRFTCRSIKIPDLQVKGNTVVYYL